jgi:AcrR family transcriptional regulator
MPTRRGELARSRIMEATRTALSERGAEQLLGGLSLREIARAAGMSPATVTYHFPTMRELAIALVEDQFTGLPSLPVDAIASALELAQREGLGAMARAAAQTNWEWLTTPEELRFSMEELRALAASGGPDGDALRQPIQGGYDGWIAELTELYRRTADTLGLEFRGGFTPEEMTRIVMAVVSGLVWQRLVDPEAVRADLAADAVVTVVSAVFVARETPSSVTELEVETNQRSRRIPSLTPAEHLEAAQAASTISECFREGVDGIPMTKVAAELGTSPERAVEWFGTVRRAAALSFSRHVERVDDAMRRRRDIGPEVSLADALCELARCVHGDPHAARALVDERLDAEQIRGADLRPDDIRLLVPLGASIVTPLEAVLDDPVTVVDLAATMLDVLIGLALARPGWSASRLADMVMRLLP